jgi:hypothetical protein
MARFVARYEVLIMSTLTTSGKDLGELVRDNLLPVVETLPDTDAMVAGLALCSEYVTAHIKVRRIEKEVADLAEQGKHKVKNKIIYSRLLKATLTRNKALAALEAFLNQTAEDHVNQKAVWNDV